MIDESASRTRDFSLDHLAVGDFVILGAVAPSGSGILDFVKRKEAEDKLIVTGPVGGVDQPDVLTSPARISTNDPTDLPTDSATFFSTLEVGDVTQVKGESFELGVLRDLVERKCACDSLVSFAVDG